MYTAVHPWQVSISVTIQVLADDDEPKEREVVGRQRHSSVWASLVRWGGMEGVGVGGRGGGGDDGSGNGGGAGNGGGGVWGIRFGDLEGGS